MKNLTPFLSTLFLILFLAPNLQAQNYGTVQLPTPDDLTPFFLGSFTDSKIYYGADPANSGDNPVLVFVHGFTDLANSWFLPGNQMYDRVYDGNYRSAFVAMTRGGGMWTNGDLLADMLEDITAHYGVDNVVIVAHSNGGKASEVAMFHHGKYDLVDRVISLGTPFYGTELANLSQTFWFSWLVDFVGLGDGAATSTTYYMGNVARPYLDNLSNNQPEKFFNFGAWGYNSGTTIFAPAMLTTGLILNANGSGWWQGGNDGVTPYWSSTRPGGLKVWDPGYGNPLSRHDHIDITFDYISWDAIEPYFTGPLGTLRSNSADNVMENRVARSNAQYLSSEGGQTEFVVEAEAENLKVNIMHQNETDQFVIVDANGNAIQSQTSTAASEFKYFSTSFSFETLATGRYQIISENQFGAIISYDNGVTLAAQNETPKTGLTYNVDEPINIKLALENATANHADAEVTAFVNRKSIPGPDGVQLEETLEIVQLSSIGGNRFSLDFEQGLGEGIYNVMIMVNGENLAKSLVTGFVVESKDQATETNIVNQTLNLFPNPTSDQLTITMSETISDHSTINIFDVYGRLIYNNTLTDQTLTLNLESIISQKGNYYLQIQDGDTQMVKPFIKL